uniref:hypothetical protein n=1 Tax=Micromonospora sp. NBC_00855 TaxID=2975978 RepID=UPI00224E37DC|nr:hypothetical protein OHB51_35480 [Micromonospora sp. NBC_00855]
MPISEAELAARRPTMTLAERVEARRALDRAAGVIYPELTDERADQIARLLVA